MAKIELWYYFEGTDKHGFVMIAKNVYVSLLKKEIVDNWRNSVCKDVDWESLTLLKVDIDPEEHDHIFHDLQVPESATMLPSMTTIQRWWPDDPTDDHLRICVRLPSEPYQEPTQKRPRIDNDDDHGEYLDENLGTITPSKVARTDVVLRVQADPNQRLVNDRPQMDTDRLPIALLYHGFGHFLDTFEGTSTDHTLSFHRRTFEMKVDEFTRSMNKYYPDKYSRTEKALEYLNNIFKCVLKNCWPLMDATVSRGCVSDGHAPGLTMGIEVVLAVVNELCATDADPIVKLSSCYTQALKRDSIRRLMGCFSFPALGIVVIGSHIGFYALSYREGIRLVELTPLLPMTAESGNDWAKPALLNAFKAACFLRYHMYKDAEEFMESAIKSPLPKQSDFPYVTEVPVYSTGGGASTGTSRTIRFQIHNKVFPRQYTQYPNRFMYVATLDDLDNKKEVIVKLTRQYFPLLHSFCASRGCAPQLLGYGAIPGGWLVVVMEKIEQQDSNLQCYAQEHLQTWTKDLKSLVHDFHDKGWVHGDLRDANMIVGNTNPEQIMLVDFDWSGKDGEVQYPAQCMHEELDMSGGDLGDLHIMKDHDDRVLGHTLKKLAMYC